MNNRVKVRKARIDELDLILELYQDLHSKNEKIADEDVLSKNWKEICACKFFNCLVLEVDEVLVSTCFLTIIPNLTRGARPYGLIENVVTAKKHQGKGWGSQLLIAALDLSWKKRLYKVMLLTGRSDEKIVNFYEKCGFKAHVKTGYVAYPH